MTNIPEIWQLTKEKKKMEKENKMYSSEVVDKATSAVAKGFACDTRSFKESVKELPEEVQRMVIASVLAGYATISVQMGQMLSKSSEIEREMKETRNHLTKEDADKLLREVFEKMCNKKQAIQRIELHLSIK